MQTFKTASGPVRWLDEADLRASLDLRRCVEAVERAFLALGSGSVSKPGVLSVETAGGAMHIKAASWPELGYFVAKVNSNYPGNAERKALPTIQGAAALFELSNGRLVALLDSAELTARRTGAATGVAVKYL
ncbi:MAG TPA: hypothetical protein VK864_00470, partial [Longimicrobiales bacterium]|nr:hypothetical protein [Longimicrobiales bacterium]